MLILAHHYTAASKRQQTRRRRFKIHLTRLLFRKGYSAEQSSQLFKVIDWMVRLDAEQATIFTEEAVVLREEPEMSAYVNTFEWVFTQRGIEKGKQLGLEQGKQLGIEQGQRRLLRAQLVRRFGELPAWAAARLEAADGDTVARWSLQLLDAAALEDVFA